MIKYVNSSNNCETFSHANPKDSFGKASLSQRDPFGVGKVQWTPLEDPFGVGRIPSEEQGYEIQGFMNPKAPQKF